MPKARLRGEKSLAFDRRIIDNSIRACNAVSARIPQPLTHARYGFIHVDRVRV